MAEFAGLASVQALAWALVHFLWQGTLIALAAALLLRASNRSSTRYGVGIAALVMMLAVPVATFVTLVDTPVATVAPESAMPPPAPQTAGLIAAQAGPASSSASAADGWWPAAGVAVWIAGMLLLSLRLAGGWIVARRMATHAVKPAAAHIQEVARSLAARLEIGRAVDVLESSAVAVPVLVGWIRPAVVFPVAALAGLSPVQIEALLAHELAHVRRHDYLVNLLQSLAEIVLFYHPAVWWLSRRVRTERELCCDDLAVGLCDRLVYATALTDLAAMRVPRVALAATGGDLLTRVRRILQREETPMSNSRWIPALIVSALILAVVPVTLASVPRSRDQAPAVPVAPAPEAVPPAEPARPETPVAAVEPVEQSPAQVAELAALVDQSSAEVQARAREMDKLRQMLNEIEAELQRAAAEQNSERRAALATRAEQQKALEMSLEDARKNLERVQRLFEVGLVSSSQLAEAEKVLKLAEAGGNEEKRQVVEVEAMERALADMRRRVEIGVEAPRELEKLQAELAQTRSRGSARDIERLLEERQQRGRADEAALERRYKDLLTDLERRQAEYENAQRRSLERAREVAPEPREFEGVAIPSRPIVPGDMLFVSIEGESALPTIYRIENNGSIRVPLLGTFKVTGQTPGQVREAIGKKLLDAKLGSPAKVKVELRQPRAPRATR